jgi:hypothetical protein
VAAGQSAADRKGGHFAQNDMGEGMAAVVQSRPT